MKILGIESSCDETSVAVVEDGKKVLSNVVVSQIEEHRLYGGVVPEIASRRHCESIVKVTDLALEEAGITLDEVDGIAVTYAPGLIGALLVGVNFAKGLSLAKHKPLIPVHHIRGAHRGKLYFKRCKAAVFMYGYVRRTQPYCRGKVLYRISGHRENPGRRGGRGL